MTAGTVLYGSISPYESGIYRSWWGLDDPAHKAWNPYSVNAFTRRVRPGRYPMGSGYNTSSIFTSDDEQRLLDKLAEEVRNHDFHAGVFLGQANQLTRQVVGTVRGLTNTVRSLKRGDLGGALRTLVRAVGANDKQKAKAALQRRDIAGAHLALVYGWLPAMEDVYQAAKAFELISNPARSLTVSVSRAHKASIDCSQAPSLWNCPGVKTSRKRIVYTMTEYMDEARAMGLYDLPSVVWELTPWSFVFDWFVPIGTYLSNLGIIPHLTGEFRISEKTSVLAEHCIPTAAGMANYGGGDVFYKEVVFLRHAVNTTPPSVPLPRFRGFDQLTENGRRIANSISLGSNLVDKLGRPFRSRL